jgi:hypothetical protein
MPTAPVSAGAVPGRTGPITGMPVSGTPAARMPVSATPVSPMPAPRHPAPPRPVPVPPPPPPFVGKRKRTGIHPALLVVIVLVAMAALPVGLLIYFSTRSYATFQPLADPQTIPVGLKTPDAFARAFLTDTTAAAIGQVDRHLDVVIMDLATRATKRRTVGDAAGWDSVTVVGDYVVALSKPENGKRTLAGVDTVGDGTWTAPVGGDGVLLTGDVSATNDNAPALLWLDRKTNQMSYVSSISGHAGAHTRGLPPNWRVLAHGDDPARQVMVVAGGAVWLIGEDKPAQLKTDPVTDATLVGRLNIADVVLAGGQDGYPVSVFTKGGRTSGFRGPANRRPVWVDGCRQNSYVCVIDQIGTDPATREFAIYSPSGSLDWRMPAPYADPSRPPRFLGDHEESSAIVSTQHDGAPGAVVFSRFGTEIGKYPGRAFEFDQDRAILVERDTGTGPVQTTFSGLDLNRKLTTRLGTPTVRPGSCSWNLTSLLCAGEKDFMLWRVTK